MSVIIAGTFSVPAVRLGEFRPHMHLMLEASRKEDGCEEYSYAEDVLVPGLIRVFEVWRDRASLEAHFKTSYMAAWRAAWPDFEVTDRKLIAYEVGAEYPI